jgi:protein-S-isoprenylcysteine O-methyltransferase Ste14
MLSEKFKENASYALHIFTFIAYFVLLFVLETPPALDFLQYIGLVLFVLGIVFLTLSLLALLRNKTGALITSGVYGIVRHPMYLGAILLFTAMVCFLPHWIMLLLSAINIIIVYRLMIEGEAQNINKFGSEYQEYMRVVPRANPLVGLMKWIKKK